MRNNNWERRDKIGKVQANRKLKKKKKWNGKLKELKEEQNVNYKRKGWDKKKGKKNKKKNVDVDVVQL